MQGSGGGRECHQVTRNLPCASVERLPSFFSLRQDCQIPENIFVVANKTKRVCKKGQVVEEGGRQSRQH